MTHISSILITVVTFAAYTLINDDNIEFNSANVFAALALFNQLTVPLFIFPITIPIIISCSISTNRIERFLSQPEVAKEFEGVRNMARMLCKSSESLDDDQKSSSGDEKSQTACKLFMDEAIDEEESDEKLLTEIKINGHDGKIADDTNELAVGEDEIVVLRNKSNKIKLRKQNQLSTSTRLERNRLRSTTAVDKHGVVEISKSSPPFRVPDETVVCIDDARFSWDGKNILAIDHLSIPKGTCCSHLKLKIVQGKLTNWRINRESFYPPGLLTVIIGKSGSGKSSIVAALLKEMQIESGRIEWNK